TTLYPASITFNDNSNYNVTGTGSGRISGGTGITKNGTGTLLMAAGLGLANDYTGPVQINGGILKMNGALSLGATNGGTTVASGASLGIVEGASPFCTNVVLNNSATSNSSGGAGASNVLSGPVTLYSTATNTITSSVPLYLVGAIGGTGGFQKSGSGALYLEA